MDDPNATKPAAKPAPRPEHMRWDNSGAATHSCTLATARATTGGIVLSFGAEKPPDRPGAGVAAQLLQQIALSPLTAKHLAATLQRLLGEIDGAAPSP